MRRHGHSLTSSRALRYYTVAYLSQTHRPIAFHCMHYGITLRAYNSEPLVKDSHKSLSTTEKPHNTACSKSRDHTFPLRTCYGEVYRNIAREVKWLTYRSRGKFITLITFELSSFREKGFVILLHFPHCSR